MTGCYYSGYFKAVKIGITCTADGKTKRNTESLKQITWEAKR